MLEVLEFILGGFWRFVGTVILCAVILDGLRGIGQSFTGRK